MSKSNNKLEADIKHLAGHVYQLSVVCNLLIQKLGVTRAEIESALNEASQGDPAQVSVQSSGTGTIVRGTGDWDSAVPPHESSRNDSGVGASEFSSSGAKHPNGDQPAGDGPVGVSIERDSEEADQENETAGG